MNHARNNGGSTEPITEDVDRVVTSPYPNDEDDETPEPIDEKYRKKKSELASLKSQAKNIVEDSDPSESVDLKPVEGAYPGFDKNNPDPNFKYSGFLYKINFKDKIYLGQIEEMDFEEIAYTYGSGQFVLHVGNNNGQHMRLRFDRAMVERLRRACPPEPGTVFDDSQIESESKPAEKNDILMTMLLEDRRENRELLKTALTSMAGQSRDSGITAQELAGKQKEGYEQGRESMKSQVDFLNEQIKRKDEEIRALKEEIAEHKDRIDELTSPEDDDDDGVSEIQGGPPTTAISTETNMPIAPESDIDRVFRGIEKGLELLDRLKPNEKLVQAQLTHDEKKAFIKNAQTTVKKVTTDELKALINRLYQAKAPIVDAAEAIRFAVGKMGILERNVITQAISLNSPEAIANLLVEHFVPDAGKDFVKYIVDVAKLLKG